MQENQSFTAAKIKELEMAEYLRSQDQNFRDGYLLGIKTAEILCETRGIEL